MCQVETIKDMDSTNFFDKTVERLSFILKNPLTFMAIMAKKMKRYNIPPTTDLKKQNNSYFGKSPSSIFKEGDIVRIRSKEEILRTLDENHKLEGCLFMDEMWQYCGTEHKIIKKVEHFYDEANYRMCKARSTVLLADLHCTGSPSRSKSSCDRYCLYFWKEAWLEKSSPSTQ